MRARIGPIPNAISLMAKSSEFPKMGKQRIYGGGLSFVSLGFASRPEIGNAMRKLGLFLLMFTARDSLYRRPYAFHRLNRTWMDASNNIARLFR